MKKLLFLAAMFAASANAQSLKFEIKPYVISKKITTVDTTFISQSDTMKIISLSICGIGEDSACVSYGLYKGNEMFSPFTSGAVNIGVQSLGVIISRPVNISNVNAVLKRWHIEATSQITD